ncbi:MAG: VIT1/CCC1 transporter family protein [Candidatus Thermoplasmatota archaeon]
MDKFLSRYLVRGFIDGILSSLGVVIGASAAIGLTTTQETLSVIIAAGVGGGIANGFSNILGASVGEKIVKEIKLTEIERAMLTKRGLKGTSIDKELEEKILKSGIYDGIATFGGALIPVSPFIIGSFFTAETSILLYVSITLSLCLFFILGVYVGRLAKESMILSGLKLVTFGVITAVIATLIRIAL